MKNKKSKKSNTDRRNFLKLGLMSGATALAGTTIVANFSQIDEKMILVKKLDY